MVTKFLEGYTRQVGRGEAKVNEKSHPSPFEAILYKGHLTFILTSLISSILVIFFGLKPPEA